MPTKNVDGQCDGAVPVEFAGKWVAWNSEHSRIIAQAETLQQLWQIAQDKHLEDPVFEKVPRADVRFVGMR